MNSELQEQIYTKYPKMFREKDLPMSQTCMCWGLEIGDGWYCLINELCYKIDIHIKQNPKLEEGFIIRQVKEKFGTLRFYYIGGDDTIDKLVDAAETESAITCEMCGKVGKTTNINGWLSTLCEEHTKQTIKERLKK